MQKIAMCAYYGMCDSKKNIVGHLGKVTEEYIDLLKERYKIYLMASPCIYEQYVESANVEGIKLGYDILIDEPFTLKKRITDKIKILKNIDKCIKSTSADTLFFYQTDFFFFLYLYLFYKKNKKRIYGLIYHQNFTGGRFEKCLNYIYRKALKKMNGVIYTQKLQKIEHENTLCVPDYLYDSDYYAKFDKEQKENKVVCLGTMNRYKQLEELVRVFKDINIPLEVYGRFDDKNRVRELVNNKSDNVAICDCILTTEEYYQKLGEAKYSILPYNMEQYTSRTSGVLLESIYVGSTPIAPKILLEQNGMVGYGYECLDDLKSFEWKWEVESIEFEKIQKENAKTIVKEKMIDFFKTDICNKES